MAPKLNCNDFEQRIHCLLDDRLLLSGDRRLMEHASCCPSCKKLAAEYEAITSCFDKLAPSQLTVDPKREEYQQTGAGTRVLGGLGLASALAATLFLVLGGLPQPENRQLTNQNVSSAGIPVATQVSTIQPQVLAVTAPNFPASPISASQIEKSGKRPERFVRNLVFSQPPTTLVELAQTTPELVSAVKYTSSGWSQLSGSLDPLNAYLQYSAEIPGVRIIQCSVEITINLLQRSLAKPQKQDPNLGWFPDAAFYALA